LADKRTASLVFGLLYRATEFSVALFYFWDRTHPESSYTFYMHPIVEPGSYIALDFTVANHELNDAILNDIDRFSTWVTQKLEEAGARYGIGGYNEHRTIYSRSALFDAGVDTEEPRRLHLGLDIWGPAHTAVMAPLAGRVHSFANNAAKGDYGATIILEHHWEGQSLFALYGHLSLDSIQDLTKGKEIAEGEPFARFGLPHENGYWPPHLHFQLIRNMKGYHGDYPGVCRYSERQQWLANSPDPILVLPQFVQSTSL
jgi:murein DD-endopeptidase MepM/ murein hydrolase activator NlpD